MTRARRWLLFALKAIVSVSLIAYLLHDVNVSEAAARAKMLSPGTGALVLLLLFTYVSVSAVRWYVVLRALGSNPRLPDAARITFIGAFFNQFLPATVGGDAVRIWESYRGGLGVVPAIHSVVLDRAGYLLGLSLLAVAGISTWDQNRLPTGATAAFWLVLAAALGLALALVALDRLPVRLLSAAFRRGTARFAADSRTVFTSPGNFGAVLLSALANQALLVIAVYVLARGLDVQVAFADCAALLPAIVLVSALPVSVAGWGVREYAMVTGFGYAGVPAASALLISLALALFFMLASTPGGVLWLLRRKPLAVEAPVDEGVRR